MRYLWVTSPLAGAQLALSASRGTRTVAAGVAGRIAEDHFDRIWTDAHALLGCAAIDEIRALIDCESWSPRLSKPWQLPEDEINEETGSSMEEWGAAVTTGHATQYFAAWCECFARLGVPSAAEWPLGILGRAGCWVWAFENLAVLSEPALAS